MQRQFKFRTWGIVSDGKLGMYYFDIKNVPNLPKEDIIMQNTNLLDKNGKEIYEGDIVKWNDDPDTTNIFYRTPNGVYEVIWKWTGFHFRDNQNCKFVPKPGEIIGNIYQDSHLIDILQSGLTKENNYESTK